MSKNNINKHKIDIGSIIELNCSEFIVIYDEQSKKIRLLNRLNCKLIEPMYDDIIDLINALCVIDEYTNSTIKIKN